MGNWWGADGVAGLHEVVRAIEDFTNEGGALHSVNGGYPLPAGLPDGAQVRIVRFEGAYRVVERDGQEWTIFMMNITERRG